MSSLLGRMDVLWIAIMAAKVPSTSASEAVTNNGVSNQLVSKPSSPTSFTVIADSFPPPGDACATAPRISHSNGLRFVNDDIFGQP